MNVNGIRFLPLICYEIIYSGNLYKNYDNYEIADTKLIPVEIPDWDEADDS